MAIFIPNHNIELNQSFGQVVNKVINEYINPELKRLNLNGFRSAGIEIFQDGSNKVYLDNDVELILEFKNKKILPEDNGKEINVDLLDIKNVEWKDKKLSKSSAKILVIHFSKDWWVWDADFNNITNLKENFKVTTNHKVRGGGHLPLQMRKQEKGDFFNGWKTGLEKELPAMWRRYLTTTQRLRGVMVYDGNYFDLFFHAQELYILGHYYASAIVCRSAAEQALISILTKVGKGFEIYYTKKEGKRPMIKGIKDLVKTCRDEKLFYGKYPINHTSEKKLTEIALIANDLVHPKQDLSLSDFYKNDALKCMDNLQYVIKKHLNFVKDTGQVSGYKISGSAKRLK